VRIEDLPVIENREFMGGKVVSFKEDGSEACIRFTPPEGMTNVLGTVQGGFAAAMIDDVVSMATHFSGGERPFVTSSLNCYYLKAIPAGVPLMVTCRVVRSGRLQAVFDAEVTTEDSDEVLVRAVQIQQFLK